uniref:Uncharacterized protein n=1 Tax=Anopheles merus TaxID=30066 RepID=A0A182VN12_ANOME
MKFYGGRCFLRGALVSSDTSSSVESSVSIISNEKNIAYRSWSASCLASSSRFWSASVFCSSAWRRFSNSSSLRAFFCASRRSFSCFSCTSFRYFSSFSRTSRSACSRFSRSIASRWAAASRCFSSRFFFFSSSSEEVEEAADNVPPLPPPPPARSQLESREWLCAPPPLVVP